MLSTLALLGGCTATPPGHPDGAPSVVTPERYPSVATCSYTPACDLDKPACLKLSQADHVVGAPDNKSIDTQFCSHVITTFTEGSLVTCREHPNPAVKNDECDVRAKLVAEYVKSVEDNKKSGGKVPVVDRVPPNLRIHLLQLEGLVAVEVSADGVSYGFLGYLKRPQDNYAKLKDVKPDCFARLRQVGSTIQADLYMDRCLTTTRARDVNYIKLTKDPEKSITGYARIDAIEALTFKKRTD